MGITGNKILNIINYKYSYFIYDSKISSKFKTFFPEKVLKALKS